MEKITRKEAIAQKSTQYFTGEPCKHGHIAYRYTSSGACSGCVRETSEGVRRALRGATGPATQSAASVRREALTELVEIKVRCYYEEWPLVRDTAIGLCQAQFPELTRADVSSKRQPTDNTSGTALYRVLVPPAHAQLVRDTAIGLFNAHKVDVEAIRARILGQVYKMVDAEASEPPEDISK